MAKTWLEIIVFPCSAQRLEIDTSCLDEQVKKLTEVIKGTFANGSSGDNFDQFSFQVVTSTSFVVIIGDK